MSKTLFSIILLNNCFLLISAHTEQYVDDSDYFYTETKGLNYTSKYGGYLVLSPKCKIPKVNPFNSQTERFFHREKYTPCRHKDLLTYIGKGENNTGTLYIGGNVVSSYSHKGVSCCYSEIKRKVKNPNPDDHIDISTCKLFNKSVKVKQDVVMVKCKDSKTLKEVYRNTHYIIKPKKRIIKKMRSSKKGAISVLFVGIDSISKLNFVRSLPRTYNYVRNNWIPLHGYNKIGDNTFPNLMAILTGYNSSTGYSKCNPKVLGKMDKCPLIWYDFRKFGYITAYAEDETGISTFNYNKVGFTEEPTDYYLRPYIIASEQLKIVKKDGLKYCTGPETTGERILNAAKDFSNTFKNYPNFGFFWINSFSHNDINSPTGMDLKVKQFLKKLKSNGVLNRSIVIFLSDHGIRFGPIRSTFSGWLEDRLPFIYISIPNWFKIKHEREYKNLINNSNKLTTPYDLHQTLQHILVLSNFNYTIKPSDACSSCKSLFSNIPNDRSCEDAAIEHHWCTCTSYYPISTKDKKVMAAAIYTIYQIQKRIKERNKNKKINCAKYTINKIISASQSTKFNYKNGTYLLIVFETKPKAIFESTVLLGKKYGVVGDINRLDGYSVHSQCTHDVVVKKYCYCI